MHEMGVAMEICRIAEQRAGALVAQLTRIAVIVGDDAGIEPSSLSFCLEALLCQAPFSGAVAEIVRGTGDELRVDYLEVDDGCPSY